MSRYKLIIFDWDGTLMDSAGKIVACMQQAAQQTNMPIPTDKAIEHIVGVSLVPAVAQLFALDLNHTAEAAKADAIAEAYKTTFLNLDTTPCPLFPGVLDLLQTLAKRQQAMAVATGKARRGLERVWENTDTRHFFIDSRCGDEAQSKPSPDMLEQILSTQGITSSEAIMVGDTCYDMQMAESIGMDRIAVSYGVHSAEILEKYNPLYIVENAATLKMLL